MSYRVNPSIDTAFKFLTTIVVCSLSIGVHAQTASNAPKQLRATAKEAQRTKIPDVTIQGQVFVVTNGGSNVKLALVNVMAYRERELLAQIDSIREIDKDERNRASVSAAEAKAVTDAAKMKLNESERGISQNAENLARSEYLSAAGNTIRAERELQALSNARYIVEKLNNPLAVAKSDADGNFEMRLPVGKYVLVALATRMAGNKTEMYEWTVRVDAKKLAKVMLSNDNMVGQSCAACVFMSLL